MVQVSQPSDHRSTLLHVDPNNPHILWFQRPRGNVQLFDGVLFDLVVSRDKDLGANAKRPKRVEESKNDSACVSHGCVSWHPLRWFTKCSCETSGQNNLGGLAWTKRSDWSRKGSGQEGCFNLRMGSLCLWVASSSARARCRIKGPHCFDQCPCLARANDKKGPGKGL